MSDTLGSLIDKLITNDMKLWYAQDFVYEIRLMDWEDFKRKCMEEEGWLKKYYESLHKATDLNLQRSNIIKEIDEKVTEMIQSALAGENLDNGKYIQDQHKTY